MIIPFADTNWLHAAYFNSPRSAAVARIQRRLGAPLYVSRPVLLECRNVFGRVSEMQDSPEWTELQRDINGRLQISSATWDDITNRTEVLIDRHSSRHPLGTLDFTILAAALLGGATHFLSFDSDSGARALAHVLGMAVEPPLTERDRVIVAKLKSK